MIKYHWRNNCTALYADEEKAIRAKVAFKTQETHWIGTQDPVIVPISIHSAFHKKVEGDLKMHSFMSTLKEHIKGKITVLLCDGAHLHAGSLKYGNNLKKSLEETRKDALRLQSRYQTSFDPCNVAFWHSYIYEDKEFTPSSHKIKELYTTDSDFRKHLQEDAEKSYTPERSQIFSNETQFIDLTIQDILEQCICVLTLAKKGYRFQFYPGLSYASIEYVNQILIPQEKRIQWIPVFLSIEKKTTIPL